MSSDIKIRVFQVPNTSKYKYIIEDTTGQVLKEGEADNYMEATREAESFKLLNG